MAIINDPQSKVKPQQQQLREPHAYSYVRFSTPEQEKGDSLRRQIHLSEEYAKKHGLTLDDSLKLTDRGLSAYKGAHRTKGALGEFLKLVEEGKIAEGSILIVENLDRLSREQVLDAWNQFTGIIQAGIKLVTLQDGMEYDWDSINQNWAQLIISIVYMARAHNESETKSKRLLAVWDNKRNNIKQKKLTRVSPEWVKLSEDGKEFILIPEVAKAVELIFKKKLSGKGTKRIETEMNDDPDVWKPKEGTRNKTGGWRESYINKIIRSRAVIGEFQPCSKRQPVGEPIKNYFPPVIDEDLFYQVQAKIKANSLKKNRGGGNTGKAKNLFTGVIKCGLCGSAMHFIDKGKPPKGRQYLVCDVARRLKTCPAKAVRYDEFEFLFFDNFEELDINQIMPGKDETMLEINKLEEKVTANQQRLIEIDREIENLSHSISKTEDSRVREQLEKFMSNSYDNKEKIETEINEHEQEIFELQQQRIDFEESFDYAKAVYDVLESAQDEAELIELRLKLRNQIQRMIEWIKIYPLMEPYVPIRKAPEPDELGGYKIMRSRYLHKVRIRFKGTKGTNRRHPCIHRLLCFTHYVDEQDLIEPFDC